MRVRHGLDKPVVNLSIRKLCELYYLHPVGKFHRIEDDKFNGDAWEVYVDEAEDKIEVHINKRTKCYWIGTPDGGCI